MPIYILHKINILNLTQSYYFCAIYEYNRKSFSSIKWSTNFVVHTLYYTNKVLNFEATKGFSFCVVIGHCLVWGLRYLFSSECSTGRHIFQCSMSLSHTPVRFKVVECNYPTPHRFGKPVQLPCFYHTYTPRLLRYSAKLPCILHHSDSKISFLFHNIVCFGLTFRLYTIKIAIKDK